jgi:hypothetical protein
MHTGEARAHGETEERLYPLNALHESPLYSERAALAWTEAVTLLSETHVPDRVYDQARAIFGSRTSQSDTMCRSDQRVEPYRDQLPLGASGPLADLINIGAKLDSV